MPKNIHIFFSCRYFRAWDYHQEAGLLIAGGAGRWTTVVEQSKNYGQTFRRLSGIPYVASGTWGVQGACFVIIDADTAILIGGKYSGRF